MRTAFVKLLVGISVSAMVALVVMGIYIVAAQSRDNQILAPQPTTIKKLPNQAPAPRQRPRYIRPGDVNPDSPTPR
jgi:hypothetical protein